MLATKENPTWPNEHSGLHDRGARLRKNAERLQIDADHIGTIGGSAAVTSLPCSPSLNRKTGLTERSPTASFRAACSAPCRCTGRTTSRTGIPDHDWQD